MEKDEGSLVKLIKDYYNLTFKDLSLDSEKEEDVSGIIDLYNDFKSLLSREKEQIYLPNDDKSKPGTKSINEKIDEYQKKIDILKIYKNYIKTKIQRKYAKEDLTSYMSSTDSLISPDKLSKLLNKAIDIQVDSDVIKIAQEKLQLLRDRWKIEDFTTLICSTKNDKCVNNLIAPPLFDEQ